MSRRDFLKSITECVSDYAAAESKEARPPEECFRIGVLTSLSGRWSKGGYSVKRGYDIWARKVNSRGGLKVGRSCYPVKLVYYDLQSSSVRAQDSTLSLLTQENVDFILGPYSSELTLTIGPIIEQAAIPHITGSAELDVILDKGFSWTFGVLLGNNEGMETPFKMLKKHINPNLRTTAVICADDVFSRSTAQLFIVTSEQLGFHLTHYDVFPSDGTEKASLKRVLTDVTAKSPDVVVVGGHVDDLINTIEVCVDVGFTPGAFVMHYGVASQDFVDALGSDATRVLGVSQWSPRANWSGPFFGSSRDFYDLFVDTYGREPDHTEAGSAAAGVVFQSAIKKLNLKPPLNDDDKEKLRDVLARGRFESFFGPVAFSSSLK